eukprot:TRINITY_DN19022_c0_g1_i1.p1 TRINITY_DN19022_c0_g1~~TRINITY_DN19022_c0_g1_i1.p1  ORF type:complete len:219 (+),score=45.55 TRINITY_DN19022_c0_g1_i1:36-692(+)
MPILYSLVARGNVILCDYSPTTGNFTLVARKLLDSIPNENAMKSYLYDRHIFHYITEDGIIYLCMTDEDFGSTIPFAFLEDVKNRFKVMFGQVAHSSPANSLTQDFGRTLQNQMNYYSTNKNATKVTKVKDELNQLKSVMVQNLDDVIDRGEKIELLVDRTENLRSTSMVYHKQATQLKNEMYWKNVKLTIVLVFIVLIALYFFLSIICGGFNLHSCT